MGWRVDVQYHQLDHAIRPKDHMDRIAPLLPSKYSPLQQTGKGLQGLYLTKVALHLADTLMDLIGNEALELRDALSRSNGLPVYRDQAMVGEQSLFENRVEEGIRQDPSIGETERRTVILARRGQGLFRERVREIERHCRITQVDRMDYLRASHIKPWSQCDRNDERLNGHNGLLLTPNIDHLFDRGFISFEDDGRLITSPVANELSLLRMGIDPDDRRGTGSFSVEQRTFMDYHREQVFL
jgi:hypothetical protein